MIEVFHGSYVKIEKPDLAFSRETLDFGKGFYLGESVKQAVSFVSNYPNSSLYIIELNNIDKLNVKYFA